MLNAFAYLILCQHNRRMPIHKPAETWDTGLGLTTLLNDIGAQLEGPLQRAGHSSQIQTFGIVVVILLMLRNDSTTS